MIKANKDKVEIYGSPEQVAAEMIAILDEFVMWQTLNGGGPAREVGIKLYEAWKHAEENRCRKMSRKCRKMS